MNLCRFRGRHSFTRLIDQLASLTFYGATNALVWRLNVSLVVGTCGFVFLVTSDQIRRKVGIHSCFAWCSALYCWGLCGEQVLNFLYCVLEQDFTVCLYLWVLKQVQQLATWLIDQKGTLLCPGRGTLTNEQIQASYSWSSLVQN